MILPDFLAIFRIYDIFTNVLRYCDSAAAAYLL